MQKKIDWDLILKYLERNYSSEDEKNLNAWLQADVKNRETMDRLKQIWNTPDIFLPEADVDKAWQKCLESTGIEERSESRILRFRVKEKDVPLIQQLFSSKILRIAAVISLFILIPYLLLKPNKSTAFNEIIIDRTQKMNITLSDNTKVTLDAGSIFRYPKKFDNQKRQVFLSGEGLFDVTLNQEKPFVIHANDGIITVLGTKFNVRAWQQDKKVAVAVIEGQVSLRSENVDNQEAKVVISKGQFSVLDESNNLSIPQNVDIENHVSWLHREKYFQQVPLREVLDQLERWYDLEILLSDGLLAGNRVTIFVENKPIEDILEVIALMNNIQYKQDGKKITFSKKKL